MINDRWPFFPIGCRCPQPRRLLGIRPLVRESNQASINFPCAHKPSIFNQKGSFEAQQAIGESIGVTRFIKFYYFGSFLTLWQFFGVR